MGLPVDLDPRHFPDPLSTALLTVEKRDRPRYLQALGAEELKPGGN